MSRITHTHRTSNHAEEYALEARLQRKFGPNWHRHIIVITAPEECQTCDYRTVLYSAEPCARCDDNPHREVD